MAVAFEFDGLSCVKQLIVTRSFVTSFSPNVRKTLLEENSWLADPAVKLVVKPDQLIKRRGKAGLVGLNLSFTEVKAWIAERMKKEIKVEAVTGVLDHFIIEPFVPHAQADEYYICIQNERHGEQILFYSEGGVDVGDVDSKALRLNVPIDEELTEEKIHTADFLKGVPDERKPRLQSFLVALFQVYRKLNFTYVGLFCILSHFMDFSSQQFALIPPVTWRLILS